MLLFNPLSALTGAVALALLRSTGTPLLWLFNPWGLGWAWWLAGYAAVRVALLVFVDGSVWLLAPRLPPLPSRTGAKAVYQHAITATDVAYLLVNSLVEFVFAQQVGYLLWHAPLIARAPRALGLANGPLALWLLFVVDDMLYAPLHRLLHHTALYRWVHKHHHRNTFPSRGYIDAANEHPVEQVAALTLHWVALHIVAHTAGLHVAAVMGHFALKALGACFNHTGYDVRLSFAGIEYSVRAHEMHHRMPNANFAQYVMLWDQLMGTYKPYESGLAKEVEVSKGGAGGVAQ